MTLAMEPLTFDCETDRQCERRLSRSIWQVLDSWRDSHDDDDLYVVCAECAIGFEVLYVHNGFYVIRDSTMSNREGGE